MKNNRMEENLKKKQHKLFKMLSKDYYHKLELVGILGIPHAQMDRITNELKWNPFKGYSKLDIVLKLSGGKLIEDKGER